MRCIGAIEAKLSSSNYENYYRGWHYQYPSAPACTAAASLRQDDNLAEHGHFAGASCATGTLKVNTRSSLSQTFR